MQDWLWYSFGATALCVVMLVRLRRAGQMQGSSPNKPLRLKKSAEPQDDMIL